MANNNIIEKLKKYIMEELERTLRWKETAWVKSREKGNPEKEQEEQMFYHYQGTKFALIQIYEYIVNLEAKQEREEKQND